jgi:oxygen-dependent protoporphyrinogen oxidase
VVESASPQGPDAGGQEDVTRSTPDLVRVAIVGGGLSGLTAAYELERRARIDSLPLEIRLYEGEDHFGGAVHSERAEGFLLEHGPASFSSFDRAALRLVVELGLQDELIPAHVERGLSIWWNDEHHPLPPGLSPLALNGRHSLLRNTLLSARGKLGIFCERWVPGRRRSSEESVSAFVTRRFGRQVLERVGEPLLAGYHCGDPAELGMHHAVPGLAALEKHYGSVTAGLRRIGRQNGESPGIPKKVTRSPVVSFRDGMEVLIDGVAAAVRRSDTGALRTGCRVTRLRPAGDPLGAAAYALETAEGDAWVADICVLALPARTAARLVGDFAPEVAERLTSIPHASSLAAYLAYDRAAARGLPETMECLVPRSQERLTLSCSLVHQQFDYRAPAGAALLCLRMGGVRKASVIDWDDATALRAARKEARALFGIAAEPTLARVIRRPRAHPQYLVGHGDRIRAIEHELDFHSGLLLCGSALYGVGIDAVIDNARTTAGTIADVARTRLA